MRKVETYERLENFYNAWVDGDVPRLAIVGRGGTGKTHGYENLRLPSMHRFVGRTSALKIYETVLDDPSLPIVFDDIRQLLKDPACLDLMKQLCERRKTRTIRWRTRAVPVDRQSFICTSSVLMVLNWIPKNDHDVDAILDRFDVLHFDPTKSEIIKRMRLFAKSQKDVDLFAEIDIIPSLRTLEKFQDWKKSPHINELEELYSECGVSQDVMTVCKLLESQSRTKIKDYAAMTGKSYSAAKRDFARKSQVARQLLATRLKLRAS